MENLNVKQIMEDACITTYDKFINRGIDEFTLNYHIKGSIAKQIINNGVKLNEFTNTNDARSNMASLTTDDLILSLAHCALKVQDLKIGQIGGLRYLDPEISKEGEVLQAYVNSSDFDGLKTSIINGAHFIAKQDNIDSIADPRLKRDYEFTNGLLSMYASFVVAKRQISAGNRQNGWKETPIINDYLRMLDNHLHEAYSHNNKNIRS